jgi:small subunit ribosomal protein S16
MSHLLVGLQLNSICNDRQHLVKYRDMLKIRMQRTGRINQPSYRIIVTEHARSPKTGNFVEELGTYDPMSKNHTLNEERAKYWLSVGAKASPTMHNMLVRLGVVKGEKINVLPRKSPPKKEGEEQAAAAPAAETKAEEAPVQA